MNYFQLVQRTGLEADRHLLRCLFSHIDFSSKDPPESNSKDYYQAQFLKKELIDLLTKPSLISNLCYAVDNHFLHQKVKSKIFSKYRP